MVKRIQRVFAVLLLTCLLGVPTVEAQVASTQRLTSLDILQTSCNIPPDEFLYALRFGQKLGAHTSTKDSKSGVSVVFATDRTQDSHFQTEITAKLADTNSGDSSIITTSISFITPTSTPSVIHATPTPGITVNVESGLDPEVLFSMANAYRANLGLSSFEKDGRVCEIAAGRGPELQGEIASGTMHSGLFGDNHPFWVTENMIYMRNNEEAFNWWLNSPVHRGQLQGNFKYACVSCVGNACAMVFTNYISK